MKAARMARGLSIRALADVAGVAPNTVLGAEQGAYPNVTSLIAIAAVLAVPVAALLGEDTGDAAAVERVLPGWEALTTRERDHFRALVRAIADARSRDQSFRRVADAPSEYPIAQQAFEEEDRRAEEQERQERERRHDGDSEDPPAPRRRAGG